MSSGSHPYSDPLYVFHLWLTHKIHTLVMKIITVISTHSWARWFASVVHIRIHLVTCLLWVLVSSELTVVHIPKGVPTWNFFNAALGIVMGFLILATNSMF